MPGRGVAAVSHGRMRDCVGMPGRVMKSWGTEKRQGRKTLPARKSPRAALLGEEAPSPLI